MNGWDDLIPTVVTAVVTTLVTLGVTGGVRAITRRNQKNETPAVLKHRNSGWFVNNRSTRIFSDSSAIVIPAVPTEDHQYQQHPLGMIEPRAQAYVLGSVMPGDTVHVNWAILSRITQKPRYFNVEVLIKEGVDDYPLSPEDSGHAGV